MEKEGTRDGLIGMIASQTLLTIQNTIVDSYVSTGLATGKYLWATFIHCLSNQVIRGVDYSAYCAFCPKHA